MRGAKLRTIRIHQMSHGRLKTAAAAAAMLLCLSSTASASTPARLRFASPLQSLTIWDSPSLEEEEESASPRDKFLPRYRAGLQAEAEAIKALEAKHETQLSGLDVNSPKWAANAAALERRQRRERSHAAERAFEKATREFDEEQKRKSLKRQQQQQPSPKKNNQYQFVGVVNPSSSSSGKAITWYARKKPENAQWSLRLVHVNKDAIIKDLFRRGKVDIFARYKNTGQADEETQQRLVKNEYFVKERSWRTLWNFSPKHFFTDPSGMYWRERRLPPGTYTDGNMVYESSYRYRDGRNGMRRVSLLDQYLNSKGVDPSLKSKVAKQLKSDAPDIVLED